MTLHLFTFVFILLKVFGYIDWAWFIVLLPSIIAFSLLVIFLFFGLTLAWFSSK